MRAWLYYFSMMYGADAGTMMANMIADAEKAVALDPKDAESTGDAGLRAEHAGPLRRGGGPVPGALEASPANSHVLILAASGFALIGKPDEAADFGDRSLRLDPRMTPANLLGVKDGYYMDRRYAATVSVIDRMPEESRSRDAWLFLAASHARLGHTREAGEMKAKLLAAFPTVSAERMLNEDYAFARKEDEDFFVDTFRVLDLPVCLRPEELTQMPGVKPLPECDAERAKATAVKS